MHNTGSLCGAYVFPRDDRMHDPLRRWKLVEWAAILPAHHVAAFQRLHHVIVALVTALEGFQHWQEGFGKVIVLSVLFYLDVWQIWMHCRSNVGSKCPGCGRPYQQVLTWPVD